SACPHSATVPGRAWSSDAPAGSASASRARIGGVPAPQPAASNPARTSSAPLAPRRTGIDHRPRSEGHSAPSLGAAADPDHPRTVVDHGNVGVLRPPRPAAEADPVEREGVLRELPSGPLGERSDVRPQTLPSRGGVAPAGQPARGGMALLDPHL